MTKTRATVIILLVIVISSLVILATFATVTRYTYRDRIVPNVSIAGVDLSGTDHLAATALLQRAYDRMITERLTVTVDGITQTIDLFAVPSTGDVAYNLIEWDSAEAATMALSFGHHENPVWDAVLTAYYATFGEKRFGANVTLNTEQLREALLAAFPEEIIAPTPTDFTVAFSRRADPVITITPGTDGKTLDLTSAFATIDRDAANLKLAPLIITTIPAEPAINAHDAELLLPQATSAIAHAPYVIHAVSPTDEPLEWTISERTIADWLIPVQELDGDVALGLDATKALDFLTELHNALDVSAQNARFRIDGSKVTEFQGSSVGNIVDDDAFFFALQNALGSNTTDAPIVVAMREELPSISTENVNDLGIKELLGEATTSFPTSATNRKANIKHGAGKLNGILIAPGETLSLVSLLKPFTIADGYVPELVIKGDEIKPEVGGGLCQIGTTVFRAIMMSGLEINERRNHSLVVSYYSDPSNGNPGTDATLYNPAPDLKFTNDMPTYVLMVGIFDEEKSSLTFQFWGNNDGRTGSYSPPVVLTRTSPGPTQYTETTDLAPGEEKCQNAFTGATTTFDYTVTYGDGSMKIVPFFSSYRALPRICLVGKAADVTASSTETPMIIESESVIE